MPLVLLERSQCQHHALGYPKVFAPRDGGEEHTSTKSHKQIEQSCQQYEVTSRVRKMKMQDVRMLCPGFWKPDDTGKAALSLDSANGYVGNTTQIIDLHEPKIIHKRDM